MTQRLLHISKELSLPIDAATQTFALIGRKGGGKTYCAGKLAELLIGAGVHTIILDLVGKWWGLRLTADGKSPGIDIPMFGGLRGDIPLEASGGALLAEALHESGSNAILDLSQFSKADRQKFCYQFGERLWRLKKSEMNPTPIHLMIEESQLIVPENIPAGGKGEFLTLMYGTFEEIIRLGRNYGIGITMITQRPQSVAKEVLNQSEPLLVFQLIGAHERKAIKLWIQHQGLDESLLDTLPSLTKGECWFWSPEWLQTLERIHISEKWTFDSTATPKVGEKHVKAREIKSLDLSDLRQRMKETIERQKQDDPKELRKTINELRGQIKKLESAKPVTETKTNTETKVVEKRIVIEGTVTRLEKLLERAEKLRDSFQEGVSAINTEVSEIRQAIIDAHKVNAPFQETVPVIPRATAPRQPNSRQMFDAAFKHDHKSPTANSARITNISLPATNGDIKLSCKQQEILNALAWYESIGIPEPSTLQVGAIALIDASGGHFSNTVGPLSSNGLVNREQGVMGLTDLGRKYAVVPESVGSLEDYHDVLRNRVRRARSAGGKTIEILNVVIAHGGEAVTTEQIGREANIDHTGGHFSNMIGPLSTVGLIKRTQGIVRPTEVLFPPGLS